MLIKLGSGRSFIATKQPEGFYLPDLLPRQEYDALPSNVKVTLALIVNNVDPSSYAIVITSIKTSFNGEKRTLENGPTHFMYDALDIIFITQTGEVYKAGSLNASPIFASFIDSLSPTAVCCIESDHIHIEPPGRFGHNTTVVKRDIMPFY